MNLFWLIGALFFTMCVFLPELGWFSKIFIGILALSNWIQTFFGTYGLYSVLKFIFGDI